MKPRVECKGFEVKQRARAGGGGLLEHMCAEECAKHREPGEAKRRRHYQLKLARASPIDQTPFIATCLIVRRETAFALARHRMLGKSNWMLIGAAHFHRKLVLLFRSQTHFNPESNGHRKEAHHDNTRNIGRRLAYACVRRSNYTMLMKSPFTKFQLPCDSGSSAHWGRGTIQCRR